MNEGRRATQLLRQLCAVAALVVAASPGLPASPAQDAPRVLNSGGFATIDWIFAASHKDLYDLWAEHGEIGKLKGSVAAYLDWPNVSDVVVLYNGWHLMASPKDKRIQHVEESLARAAFGDRFKGENPGGSYVLLFEYKSSDRRVVVGFKEGVFLVEGIDGIGAVDVRGPR